MPGPRGDAVRGECPKNTTHSAILSKKITYSRSAQKRLAEARTKLARLQANIGSSTIAGRVRETKQLVLAQRAVEANLAAAECSVEKLRKSGEDSWESLIDEVDTTWEDLSLSIKKLVGRYSDCLK